MCSPELGGRPNASLLSFLSLSLRHRLLLPSMVQSLPSSCPPKFAMQPGQQECPTSHHHHPAHQAGITSPLPAMERGLPHVSPSGRFGGVENAFSLSWPHHHHQNAHRMVSLPLSPALGLSGPHQAGLLLLPPLQHNALSPSFQCFLSPLLLFFSTRNREFKQSFLLLSSPGQEMVKQEGRCSFLPPSLSGLGWPST